MKTSRIVKRASKLVKRMGKDLRSSPLGKAARGKSVGRRYR